MTCGVKRDSLLDVTHYGNFLDALVDTVKIVDIEQVVALSERFVSLNNLHGNVHQLDLERHTCLLSLGNNPRSTVYYAMLSSVKF